MKSDFGQADRYFCVMETEKNFSEPEMECLKMCIRDRVKWSLGMNSLIGPTFPESMIPSNIKKMLQSDNYEVQFICSEYSLSLIHI